MEICSELVSLQNQLKASRLQDKLEKQKFHEQMRKVFQPVTKTIKKVSEDVIKTMVEISSDNNRALAKLNEKLVKITKDRGILASYFLSPLSETTNPENTSQFKLVKDPNSNRVNDLLIKKKISTNYSIQQFDDIPYRQKV